MPSANGAVQDEFREAMRRLATTVTIVTVHSGSERHGTTATAVTSLCMEPPSILVCINQDSRLHGFMSREARFCVNLLHVDNVAGARSFSRPLSSTERFADGDWRQDELGVPYLADAQANVFCVKEKDFNYGSHTIFIGRVVEVRTRPDIAPLLYTDGGYAQCLELERASSDRSSER